MNNSFFPILILVFVIYPLYLILRRHIPSFKITLPIRTRARIIREEIKGLENLPPEKVEKAKKEFNKVKKLTSKVTSEILFRIREEKPDISNEELSERVMIEFEREKLKYPELKHTSLKDFKILRSESSIKKE